MHKKKHLWLTVLFAGLPVLLIALLLIAGFGSASPTQPTLMGYETLIFNKDRVHSIRIYVDDLDSFWETCPEETYTRCTVVINDERFENVGVRAKGNSSLTEVAEMGSCRYSLKLEFDHYDSRQSYHGLDKLNLNNLIQDNTMMKDYLTYQLMAELGAAAPLCSYTKVYVNDWSVGLYLAVEAIEESFLQRYYGSDYGELYKPDAANSGNEPDRPEELPRKELHAESLRQALEHQKIPTDRLGVTDWSQMTVERLPKLLKQLPGVDVQALMQALADPERQSKNDKHLADVKLQYLGDDPDRYPNIFGNAKTGITEEDQARLIRSLKQLSTGKKLNSAVDIEGVCRYFAVHNFVCNQDSYTGPTVHNYYLYEKDGRLSMLPWDYNLSFGGMGSNDANAVINASVYQPVAGGSYEDRPMLSWILDNRKYTWLYQRYLMELLDVDMEAMVIRTRQLIAPYVLRDPTKFCSYAEFEAGVDTLLEFLDLRSQSVQQQILRKPADVDVGEIDLSKMGGVNRNDVKRKRNDP